MEENQRLKSDNHNYLTENRQLSKKLEMSAADFKDEIDELNERLVEILGKVFSTAFGKLFLFLKFERSYLLFT